MVGGNYVSFVGSTDVAQKSVLLQGLEFLVAIVVSDAGGRKCHGADRLGKMFHGLVAL